MIECNRKSYAIDVKSVGHTHTHSTWNEDESQKGEINTNDRKHSERMGTPAIEPFTDTHSHIKSKTVICIGLILMLT